MDCRHVNYQWFLSEFSEVQNYGNSKGSAGWISTTPSTIVLTQKGRDKAIELKQAMAQR